MSGVVKEYISKLGCESFFCAGLHTEHSWRCSHIDTLHIFNLILVDSLKKCKNI
jgi:hypothetical protein